MKFSEAEEIFNRALELASAEEQAAFVKGACGTDAALRQKVERLLQAHRASPEFLATEPGDHVTQLSISEGPGVVIDRYKLLQQIGEGGFGVVYMAEQKEPVKRRVALKIIKLGMDTKQVVARFEAERQALAMMDHPNIAKVLDGGATESGRPYFVMELVKGVPITRFCDENNLSTKERLELFTTVCNAIQHAHQKGIIHRDVKPSNILVTLHDGKPVPKVIDFGIAKATQQELTEKTIFTQFQQMIGTPAYMSPEQAEMSGLDIDTRTDIYSLGVLLYELLTGKTPLDAKILLSGGYDEIRRRIKEEEPLRPSTRVSTMAGEELTTNAKHRNLDPKRFAAELRGDLDWIVMKALEKDRTRRYETANGFAADLKRHLNNEPVAARPPSNVYRFQKLVRRNKLAFAAAGAVATALLFGIVATSLEAIRAERARAGEAKQRRAADEARTQAQANEQEAKQAQANEAEQRRLLRRHAYVADMGNAYQAVKDGNLAKAATLVERYLRPAPGEEDLRGFEWRYLWERCQPNYQYSFPSVGRSLRCAVFSPDGKIVATGGRDANVTVLDVFARSVLTNWGGFDGMIDNLGLIFSRDGRLLAAKGGHVIRVWSTDNWREVFHSTNGIPNWNINDAVVISPDRTTLATRIEGGIGFWDLTTGQQLNERTLKAEDWVGTVMAHSRDGKMLAISKGLELELRDARSLSILTTFVPSDSGWAFHDRILSVAFSTNLVAAGYRDGEVRLWDAKTWREVAKAKAHSSFLTALGFSPDGEILATGGSDQTIYLWKVADLVERRSDSETPYATFKGHADCVSAVMFSPDDQTLASSSYDGTVKLWSVRPTSDITELTLIDHPDFKTVLWFSSDGKRLLLVNHGHKLYLCETSGSVDPRPLDFPTVPSFSEHGRAVSPDGKTLAVGTTNGAIQIWNLDTGKLTATFQHEKPTLRIEFSADGRFLISAHKGGGIRIRNLAVGQTEVVLEDLADPFVLSPDGRLMAAHRKDRHGLALLNLGDGRPLDSLQVQTDPNETLAFSPNGRLLATSKLFGKSVLLWDLASRQSKQMPVNEATQIGWMGFAPDGKTLVLATADNVVSFWNVATSEEIMRESKDFYRALPDFVFSPNGENFVGRGKRLPDGTAPLVLWHAPSLAEIDTIERAKIRGASKF